MAALSGEKTLAELSAEFGVHPTMISGWKQELVKRAGELFARGSKAPARRDNPDAIAPLRVDDGQYLTVGHPEQDAALLAVGFAFVDPLAMANVVKDEGGSLEAHAVIAELLGRLVVIPFELPILSWISDVRPSRRSPRGFLRMRFLINAISELPHAEERSQGALIEARITSMQPIFTVEPPSLNSWKSRSSFGPGRRYRPIGSCRLRRRAGLASGSERRRFRDGPRLRPSTSR